MNSNNGISPEMKEMALRELARRELDRRNMQSNPSIQQMPQMANTFLGQLPKDVNSQMINNQDLTKELLSTATGGSSESAINGALKLTNKNIIKDILKTSEENKQKYSVLYKDLFKEAEQKELGNLSHVADKIDYKTIEQYTPASKITKLDKFIKDPTVKNAHHAKSDLMKINSKLENKDTLIGGERDQYNAITDAINKLKNNMFKTKQGNIDENMFKKYEQIQSGYANDVVPYTYNKSIKKYLNKKMLDKELISALSKGEFAAKVGDVHNIGKRDMLQNILKYIGIPAVAGVAAKEGFQLGSHSYDRD